MAEHRSGGGDEVEAAFHAALGWSIRERFRGYDPYDGLNTRHALLRRTRPVRLGMIYLNKFSPVNLRPLLGIPRHATPAGVALAARVLLRRGAPEHLPLVREQLEFVLSKSLHRRYGRHCWNGTDFPVQMRGEYQTEDVPGVVGTTACAHLVLDCWRRNPERDDLREVLGSVRAFLFDVLLQEYEGAVFFRYKPITPAYRCTYNASALAAGFVARLDAALGEPPSAEVAACFRFVAARQKPDGRWNYSVDLRTGVEKPQVDFHQGYVLDEIQAFLERAGPDATLQAAHARGLEFYRREQFTPEGRGLYRWPRSWPVNVHNQAQGVLTFARAESLHPGRGHLAFARAVALWTIRNLFDGRGFFCYLKYPFLTYRIPYFRWSQAAMLDALDTLLRTEGRAAVEEARGELR